MNYDRLAIEFHIDHQQLFNKFMKVQNISFTGKTSKQKLDCFSLEERDFLSCLALKYLEESVNNGLLDFPDHIFSARNEKEIVCSEEDKETEAIPIDTNELFTPGEVQEYTDEKCAACPAREHL